MPNKYRETFDCLVKKCKLVGLPEPYMTPGHLREEYWFLWIGENRFCGTNEQALERAQYFVSGYIQSVVDQQEQR